MKKLKSTKSTFFSNHRLKMATLQDILRIFFSFISEVVMIIYLMMVWYDDMESSLDTTVSILFSVLLFFFFFLFFMWLLFLLLMVLLLFLDHKQLSSCYLVHIPRLIEGSQNEDTQTVSQRGGEMVGLIDSPMN